MSCTASPPTFRLLDGLVGWDAASVAGISGVWDPDGIRLTPQGPAAGVSPAAVWPFITPPRLAYDCGTCTWFLVTPKPPASRLLHLPYPSPQPPPRKRGEGVGSLLSPSRGEGRVRGLCETCDAPWKPVFDVDDMGPAGAGLVDLVAVAVTTKLIAVADRTRGEVRVWSRDGAGAFIGRIVVTEPTYLAFASPRDLLVVSARRSILRFDPAGVSLGELPIALAAGATIEAVARSADGAYWALIREADGRHHLHRLPCREDQWEDATLADLRAAFTDTGLIAVAPEGFWLRRNPRDRASEICGVTWFGRPSSSPPPPPPPDPFATQGQLLTTPIDSGRPRCRWHRLRIDGVVPTGCGLEVAVATAETLDSAPQGEADPGWPGFDTGVPHPLDWQRITGQQDALIDQPPGRYLWLRVRLTGPGTSTPVVRALRLDMPRSTSLNMLPAVYREDPRAEDFTERFLALFDAGLEDLDRAVEQLPALLDVQDTPEDALPWLGRFLDTVFDPAWDAKRRRRILAAMPALYARRGTLEGLADAVELVFDVRPVIEEIGAASIFGAIASGADPSDAQRALGARLGEVRLFGRARVRFRLGASALSQAPLRSYGDPAVDPIASGAFRFRVFVPAGTAATPEMLSRLRRLVDSQKPAHTVAEVTSGSRLPILAGDFRVGIDTRLSGPPPAVLGAQGNVRLRRDAILR